MNILDCMHEPKSAKGVEQGILQNAQVCIFRQQGNQHNFCIYVSKETSIIFVTLKKFERMFEWKLCENVCLLGGRSFLQLRGGR